MAATSLQQLIAEGEHQCQDFKYKVTDAVKLAKSVSAFANTDGGRLLIGVRDDGHLSGVRSEEEIFMMRKAGEECCRPAVSIDFTTFREEGRTIVMAEVPVSLRKPVRAICDDGKWRAFIRVADENIVASPVHLRIWLAERSPRGTLLSVDAQERAVMQALEGAGGMTLRQVVRRSGVARHQVVNILAHLVRFGLATCQLSGGEFLFEGR